MTWEGERTGFIFTKSITSSMTIRSMLAAVATATMSATTSLHTPVPRSGAPPPPAPACAGWVQNETDIVGGKILAKVLTPDTAACCRWCFSTGAFPTADAWVRENQTVGNCWCVENARGTKPAPSRTVGHRAPDPHPHPSPPPPPPPPPPMPGPRPSPAVLEACKAAATLDPPGTMRKPSGSFEHVAMAANSTASDCTALCCLDWNCVAFSFDTVATICSLLDELAPITNTSDPVSVVTGFLAKLAATPPPFPQSTKFHSNVTFKSEMYFGTEGDSWPTTWLQDNTQLTAAGDRGDFGTHMSMWRVNGTAPTTVGDDIPMQPVGSVVWSKGNDVGRQYCGSNGKTLINNVKPTTLLSVDGNVYWGITCMDYGDDKQFQRQRNFHAGIAKATDSQGQVWNFSATPSTFFSGRLAAPMFIQYGQDYRDAVDGFVYAHFPVANDEFTGGTAQSFWDNNDDVLLGRVPKSEILSRGRWEFWRGAQPGNDAWTSDESAAVSVMHWPLMISMNQVNYHRPSGRYLTANYGFIDHNGQPRPWHQHPKAPGGHRTQLTFFEAKYPWGPFSIFHRDDDWRSPDGAAGAYCPVFPPKWMEPTSALMVSASCCAKPSGILHHYNFSAQRLDFSYNSH